MAGRAPQRLEARPLVDDANGHATPTLGDPLRLVEYDYDSQGRLTTVTRHLAPNNGDGPDGAGFVTTLRLRRFEHPHRQRDAERRHQRVLHL